MGTVLHWLAMRFAGFRCRLPAVVAVIVAAAAGLSVSVAAYLTGPVSSADAAAAPLTLTVDRSLGLLGEELMVNVKGQLELSLVGTHLALRFLGPAGISQVGQAAPELPEANNVVLRLGQEPTTTTTATPGASSTTAPPGPGQTTTTTVPPPTTTTIPATIGPQPDLEKGLLEATVTVPGDIPSRPGAYLLVVEVRSEAEMVLASGRVWMGKAEPREQPLDLAFVWPISMGIHRDADGIFYDRALDQAMAPGGSGTGDLRALAGLSTRFPGWNFTLAVEPVLTSQLRDMADGYSRYDEEGKKTDIPADDSSARNATELMAAFKALAGNQSVEVAVSPYSGADLGVLAGQGWRDGFEQIQMGKQELQQSIGVAAPPTGGYAPQLDLSSESLSCYAQASIDHVVVSSSLTRLLSEPPVEGTTAVRARDGQNNRVTLVFAAAGLAVHMSAPWDTNTFFAALAAELAASDKEALVISPKMEFQLPPAAYVDSIGKALQSLSWIKTSTVSALLRDHPPDTRPVLLTSGPAQPLGYIEESLLADLQAAHAAVNDLAAIADPTRSPVEASHRLLYAAQSLWWARNGTTPQEATIGLNYAREAQRVAKGELEKIRLVGADPAMIWGNNGVVSLGVQNDATYPVTVGLRVEGSGVTVKEGEGLAVELQPGRTAVPLTVTKAPGSHSLEVSLMAGDTVLDQAASSLRFITVMTLLPWGVAALVVIAAGAFLVARWRLRKRRPPAAAAR